MILTVSVGVALTMVTSAIICWFDSCHEWKVIHLVVMFHLCLFSIHLLFISLNRRLFVVGVDCSSCFHPSGVNQRFFLSSWNSSFAIESSVLPAILFRRSFGRTRPIRDHIFVMENYWGLLLLQRYWFMLTQYLLALQFHLQLRERKRGKNSQCKQWFTIENPSSGDSVANI